MTRSEGRRGESSREAILEAAESAFAENGFDGARVDMIAQISGYDKKLLFRYFGDKLGLYTEVLKRADREANALLARVFAPMLADGTAISHAQQWRHFLETMVQTLFDYLLDHPRLVRILTWEMAEGGQTLTRIASEFPTENTGLFERLFPHAYQAGLLRSDFAPVIQLTMLLQICQIYLVSLPLYQRLLPGEDLSSASALTRAREHLVTFLVGGMMADQETAKP
ncbi:TetR family transcriptional regulator [Ktedonosporobacter rubrisoli]|uniref:TetR family transcriptional regulator n=1 Tax=Ktedonosporobacter rubrisoli TaxID=2509675 RepID=A0A4P6JZL8_KTERU|nr:TetR/AcrR family transcriptional regulator [Ktedonosporobacter rubrisoli]QBD80860.1 TetR family transcriptional regulator [Ktedonosporobacter rubrisoli]